MCIILCFFFQAEDGIRDWSVTGVQTCALPISSANTRGRIYNFRIGLRADWPRVFAEATKLDKALEVDCYPDRQDLNVALLKIAREHGTRISLGTDAHHPWQLEFIELGLAAVLRAKLPPERIINFMTLEELKNWIQTVRTRRCEKITP